MNRILDVFSTRWQLMYYTKNMLMCLIIRPFQIDSLFLVNQESKNLPASQEKKTRSRKKTSLNYIKPNTKHNISDFLELLRHFKVFLKDSTKKSVKESVSKISWFSRESPISVNFYVFSLNPCFFFLKNCRKTYQAIYEKQRINLERPYRHTDGS